MKPLREAVVRPVHVETLTKVRTSFPSAPVADCAGEMPGLFWAREVIVENRELPRYERGGTSVNETSLKLNLCHALLLHAHGSACL